MGAVRAGRVLDVVRLVVGLLVLAAIAVALQRNWTAMVAAARTISWSGLVLSAALCLTAPVLTMVGWRILVIDLGARLSWPASRSIFFVGQLGKYLPGSVWSAAIQADLGGRLGLPRRALGVAGLLNLALAVLTGALVGIPAIPLLLRRADEGAVSPWWPVLAAVLAVVVLWPRLLNAVIARGLRLLRREPLPTSLSGGALVLTVLVFMVAWATMGAGLWVLALSVSPPDVDASALALATISGFCLAGAIGMLAIVAPAGAGVRDGVLVLLLVTFLPLGAATAVVIIHRVWTILADLLLAGLGHLWARSRRLIGAPGTARQIDDRA